MSNTASKEQVAQDAAVALALAAHNRQRGAKLDERVISEGVAALIYDQIAGTCSVEIDGRIVGRLVPNGDVAATIRTGVSLLPNLARAAGLGALESGLEAAISSTPFVLAVHVLDNWKVRIRYDDMRPVAGDPADADVGPPGYALHIRPSSQIQGCKPEWFRIDPEIVAAAIENKASLLASVLAVDAGALALLAKAAPEVEKVVIAAEIAAGTVLQSPSRPKKRL